MGHCYRRQKYATAEKQDPGITAVAGVPGWKKPMNQRDLHSRQKQWRQTAKAFLCRHLASSCRELPVPTDLGLSTSLLPVLPQAGTGATLQAQTRLMSFCWPCMLLKAHNSFCTEMKDLQLPPRNLGSHSGPWGQIWALLVTVPKICCLHYSSLTSWKPCPP